MATLNVFNIRNKGAGRPCRKAETVSQRIPANRESEARYGCLYDIDRCMVGDLTRRDGIETISQ